MVRVQIQQVLNNASAHLCQSDSSRLDAELLLAHVLGKRREFLVTWPETDLSEAEQQMFSKLLEQRAQGYPLAYLVGSKAFWDFDLTVNSDVLIPRPETELLVELVLECLDTDRQLVADLGTGSGAIALALAKERKNWQLVASDSSVAALRIARLNAQNLEINNIEFRQGSWLDALQEDQTNARYDAIISNPPYIDAADEHLSQGDLRFEPVQALVAGQQGLADLKQIIIQSRDKLKNGAILLLEHGFQQGEAVRQLFAQSGYNEIQTHKDLAGLERATLARK